MSCKWTVLSPYQNTCQAFCSSYCFVIYYTSRQQLALGMVPFSRRNNIKEQESSTQKANQSQTYTLNKAKRKPTNQQTNPKSLKNPDHQKRPSPKKINLTKKTPPSPPKKYLKSSQSTSIQQREGRRILNTTKILCLGSLQTSQPSLFGHIIFLACTVWTNSLLLDQQSILK